MSASNGDSRKDPPPPPPPPPPPGMLLAGRFPVNSLQEVTLHDGATFAGRVYCTDEMTGSLVLKSSLVHTTLACEMRIINVASIETSKVLPEGTPTAADSSPLAASLSALDPAPPPELPLPKIQKKALEERERKALKLAEERFRQINQKASPLGQAVFDKLLKACGEVVWTDQTTILVNGNIRVEEPYEPGNERFVAANGNKNTLDDGSLDRVKKIVAAAVDDFRSKP